jgi:hypothetical protein
MQHSYHRLGCERFGYHKRVFHVGHECTDNACDRAVPSKILRMGAFPAESRLPSVVCSRHRS